MNDRAQGGSSLEEGKLSLMQNRRIFQDDGRGVGEALDETNAFGNGIIVRAQYHIQLFNFRET